MGNLFYWLMIIWGNIFLLARVLSLGHGINFIIIFLATTTVPGTGSVLVNAFCCNEYNVCSFSIWKAIGKYLECWQKLFLEKDKLGCLGSVERGFRHTLCTWTSLFFIFYFLCRCIIDYSKTRANGKKSVHFKLIFSFDIFSLLENIHY